MGAAAGERPPLIAGLIRKRCQRGNQSCGADGECCSSVASGLMKCSYRWETGGIGPMLPPSRLTVVLIFPLMLLKITCWVLSSLLSRTLLVSGTKSVAMTS